jgi:hypothetical protein
LVRTHRMCSTVLNRQGFKRYLHHHQVRFYRSLRDKRALKRTAKKNEFFEKYASSFGLWISIDIKKKSFLFGEKEEASIDNDVGVSFPVAWLLQYPPSPGPNLHTDQTTNSNEDSEWETDTELDQDSDSESCFECAPEA